ncbi:MAG: RimK family alpha-L-glutamate ligase, partial [Planctomycetota bacterium]|nr:RimK family alpha-L-glutamate ligase [Planctomycetota bacterium]
ADLDYEGEPVTGIDAVVPRIGASTNVSGIAVLRQFEERGVYSLNGSDAILRCRDKFRCIQLLSGKGIPVPPTSLTLRQDDVRRAIVEVGGPPVILKVLEGAQGKGVFLAESEIEAEEKVEALHQDRRYVLIQKFISECRGRDLRAFVVGDEVVAAIRRSAEGEEFRSNVHLGGNAVPAEVTPEVGRLAVGAARTLGLEVAGVDFLETDAGPLVLEVNASPGLEGIETVSGTDIAGRIVALLERERGLPA